MRNKEDANVCPISDQCLPNVCPMSAQCLPNVCPISAQYLPNICPMSAQCLSNVYPMSVKFLTDVSPMSEQCLSINFAISCFQSALKKLQYLDWLNLTTMSCFCCELPQICTKCHSESILDFFLENLSKLRFLITLPKPWNNSICICFFLSVK